MRKINRKRLNNKGFTLIELLAVVVILAVVMGIAMTSVLSAMNKSRGGSLADTSMVIAQAFNQKYTESLVGGVPTNVYAEGTATGQFGGYNFSDSAVYYLDDSLATEFNISTESYKMAGGGSEITGEATGVTDSFVSFDASTGKFIVCMTAVNTGSYYVANYAVGGADANGVNKIELKNFDVTFSDTVMFACSDGTQSW